MWRQIFRLGGAGGEKFSRNINVGRLFASSATAGIIHTGAAADVGRFAEPERRRCDHAADRTHGGAGGGLRQYDTSALMRTGCIWASRARRWS